MTAKVHMQFGGGPNDIPLVLCGAHWTAGWNTQARMDWEEVTCLRCLAHRRN